MSIQQDLQKDRPCWPLSVYASGKEESCLISGTDVSFEEARLQFILETRQTGKAINYVL